MKGRSMKAIDKSIGDGNTKAACPACGEEVIFSVLLETTAYVCPETKREVSLEEARAARAKGDVYRLVRSRGLRTMYPGGSS
jgi:hypothetical protein